jgi:hypothetical protein
MASTAVFTSNVLGWERPQETVPRCITLSSTHTTEIISILRTVTDVLYGSHPQELFQAFDSIRDKDICSPTCFTVGAMRLEERV